MCNCIECGDNVDCGDKYCIRCELKKNKGDKASKNLEASGRFYEKPKKDRT
jgi:hypothetical protein